VSGIDVTDWTLTGLSDGLRKKDVSPVEITRACLDRIEEHDGRMNAFITRLDKPALKAATRAEFEILRGRYRGPLHGVPYALKDLFRTRGIRTTCGSQILSRYVPTADAAVVERLIEAGAVLLGKLNMHEFAFGTTSVNPHYGAVRNPWDQTRITGGSSGGSAAAVAAGFAFFTLGTDTGGSIRIPAALCGVSGLKPTYGRVSRHGVYPLAWSMDHVGPFAADVSGLAIVMNAVAGHDRRDPGSALAPVSDYSRALTADLSGLTLGVPRQLFFDDLDDEVRRAVRRAIADLKRAGARVTPVSVPLLDDASRAASLVLFAEAAASLEKWHRTSPSSLGEDIRARLGMGAAIPAADYLKALRVRRRVQQAFRRVFERVDALVTPQLPITAPRIGDGVARINGREEPVPAALTRYTRIYNLTGLPSLSVCCGFSRDGLPIGLQIAARPFDEATTLRIGHAYQRHAPIDRRQPDLRNPD